MTGFYEDYDDTSGVHLGTAEQQATNAANSATAAATSETNAANSATAAATSETNAATSATNASTSETNAATSATNAATSETNAATSETNAANSAVAASTSETNAATSATNASTSETNAANSATAAATSETNAGTSETNAAASATAAATSETNAATSESNASTSETNAAASATAAATSETNAATSETNAATSETNAATSATNAATSETNAATSETNASTSETNASDSATSAATAQTAAEAARDAALAAFDSFDDRYLGPYSSDPTTDNDGDALAAGMLYYNTTDDVMKVYEGSSWVAAYASLSGALIANNNLSDLNNAGAARTNLGLGTAATTAASDYATAAQADQTVSLTGTGATSVTGTYPSFTIDSTDTTYTAGTGLSLTGTEFANTAPDQTVSLTGAGATTVSGTYPNFTITGSDTTYTASNGITLSGTDFQLTDTNAKLNLTGGTLTGDVLYAADDAGTTTYELGVGQLATAPASSFTTFTSLHIKGQEAYQSGSTGNGGGSILIEGGKAHPVGSNTRRGGDVTIRGGDASSVGTAYEGGVILETPTYTDLLKLNTNGTVAISSTAQNTFTVSKPSGNGQRVAIFESPVTNAYTSQLVVEDYTSGNGVHLSCGSSLGVIGSYVVSGGYGKDLGFYFGQGGEGFRMTQSKRLGIGTTSPAQALHVVGSIVATGNITAYYSDERLKDFKGKIDNPLEKINTLNGYYFKPNETALIAGAEQNGLEVGVSAQEVEKVLPEIVSPSALGKDYKTVSYEKLTPLLIEAVKELSAKVDDLELRLQNLEK